MTASERHERLIQMREKIGSSYNYILYTKNDEGIVSQYVGFSANKRNNGYRLEGRVCALLIIDTDQKLAVSLLYFNGIHILELIREI